MRLCRSDAEGHRIQLGVPCLGVVGLLFVTYVCLYGAGIIDWKVFPNVEGFRPLDRSAPWDLIMAGMALVLLSSARIKVTVNADGVVYRGCVRTVRLQWCDVTRMTYAPHGIDICLWTKRKYVRFGQYLSRGDELLGRVKERVSAIAPGAEIVQAQPRFLPQWRKPERGADTKVETERH